MNPGGGHRPSNPLPPGRAIVHPLPPTRGPISVLPPPTRLPDPFAGDPRPTSVFPPFRPDVFRAKPGTYTRVNPYAPLYGYYGGYVSDYADTQAPADAANGYLQLQVQPASALVYADGLYVGNVDDIRRSLPGRTLEPGAHRIELRAPGYETVGLDVRIDPGETTTYRADLMPVVTAPPAPPLPPAKPKTFYVIPGCYAGDKRPDARQLPQGCLAANVREVPPLVNRVTNPAR